MIPVAKPAEPPPVLVTKGKDATQRLCDAYRQGATEFQFDSSIYGAREVKDALRAAQYRKCAFCESKFDHTGYGDVEHFRPKGGYKQREQDVLKRPGYYWLAYAWVNLFYVCQICNQQFKRNLFPLKDGRRRARSHTYDTGKEEPLLLDPSACDPSNFISFREEYAVAVGGCVEGETTIEILGLNQTQLVEIRRDYLRGLKLLVRSRDRLRMEIAVAPSPKKADELREHDDLLAASVAAAGQWSAMARAYLAALSSPEG